MKIFFRISTLSFGGAERVFISVADYLAKVHQTDVHFVVDSSVAGGTEEVAIKHGFKVHVLGCSRTLTSIMPLKRFIDLHRPDILISAYTDTNAAALISVKLAQHKCLTVVSEHASLDEHWQNASFKRRILLNAYVKYVYRMADHVLGVSKGIRDQLVARLGSPACVTYIHNPIRFNVPKVPVGTGERPHTAPRTILAVGRIARQKDYACLLAAFKLATERVDCRLVIVGGVHEQGEKDKLDRFVDANNLATKIEFVGFTDQVEKYYQAADVYVMSSAWEGFGNVLVEALAFGLPVISTNCNHGPDEILCGGQYGHLVPVGDAAALANAICTVLTGPPPDKTVLQRRAEDFSEERIGAQYWTLIQKLVASR